MSDIVELLQALAKYADRKFTGELRVWITMTDGGIAKVKVYEVKSGEVAP